MEKKIWERAFDLILVKCVKRSSSLNSPATLFRLSGFRYGSDCIFPKQQCLITLQKSSRCSEIPCVQKTKSKVCGFVAFSGVRRREVTISRPLTPFLPGRGLPGAKYQWRFRVSPEHVKSTVERRLQRRFIFLIEKKTIMLLLKRLCKPLRHACKNVCMCTLNKDFVYPNFECIALLYISWWKL